MTSLNLALAAAIVVLVTVAALAVVWWRRRAAAPPTVAADGEELPPLDDGGPPADPDEEPFAPPAEALPLAEASFAPPAAVAPEPVDDALAFDEPSPRDFDAPIVHETPLDPMRTTRVTFHLQLPTQGHARSAGQIARREGYVADVQPPRAGTTSWLCLLTREMTPSPEEIEIERASLADLAGGFGGQLERWEAERSS